MNHLRIILSFCFLIAFVANIDAQWKSINAPYGYNFQFSYIGQKGDIFLECSDDIYYSDDLGTSWSKTMFKKNVGTSNGLKGMVELLSHDVLLNNGDDVYQFNKTTYKWDLIVKSIYPLINIDHQGRIWFKNTNVAKNGFYMSKDLGKTYQFFDCPELIESNSSLYIDSYLDQYNILYISNQTQSVRKLYRFTDNGNFSFLMDSGYRAFVNINQSTGTVYFLNGASKLCRSVDGGVTNASYDFDYNPFLFEPFMYTQFNGNILLRVDGYDYITTNDGSTWSLFTSKLTNSTYPEYYNSALGYGNSTNTIIATDIYCSRQGIYVSTDNGSNWTVKNKNFDHSYIDKMVEDNLGNLYAFTCSESTVLKSIDKGISWNKYLAGSSAVKDIAIKDNGDIYVSSVGAILKSNNGGVNFKSIGNNGLLFFDGQQYGINLSPKGYIYLKHDETPAISKNDGVTWEVLNNTKYSAGKDLFDLNDDVYFITEKNKLFSKYNPDSDIVEIFDINNDYKVLDFDISKNGIIYFMVVDKATNQYLFGVSKDKMKSYEFISNVQTINDLFSDELGNLYAVRDDGIYIYNDLDKVFKFFTIIPGQSPNTTYYLSPNQSLYAYNDVSSIYQFENVFSAGSWLKGAVFNDSNLNCNLENNEVSKMGVLVEAVGITKSTCSSDINGIYKLRLKEGNYDISAKSPNSLWQACPSSNVLISPNQGDTAFVNLALQAKELCPYLSVDVQMPNLRICLDNKIYIRYCNEGTTTASNVVLNVTLPDKLNFLNSTIAPSNQSGNELAFGIGNIPSGDCGDIIINTNLSCDAFPNDVFCVHAKLTPNYQCITLLPEQSETVKCVFSINAYDPNHKTSYINGKPSEGTTEMNQDIEYLISFQNTGTDTAFRVVVEDIIPKGYNLNSLKPLNSSSLYTLEIEGNRKVKFIFDPIMLPDSNTNEAASHGFIAFKISPDPDLDYGTKLDNFADIYFDFNEAVSTNTDFLTVSNTTQSLNILNGLKLNYYPNPTKGGLTIQLEGDTQQRYTIKVSDILGKELVRDTWNGSNYELKPKTQLFPGIYFMDIEDNNGKHGFGKFVVE